jgi:hypothetical protein
MIRQRTAVAGLKLFQPLAAVAASRLVSGYPLGEQKSLDAVDVANPLSRQGLTLAAKASAVLLLGFGHPHHRADARLAAFVREQRANQRLAVDLIGLCAPTAA